MDTTTTDTTFDAVQQFTVDAVTCPSATLVVRDTTTAALRGAPWQRSHASTQVMSTGGVRPLQVVAARLRVDEKDASTFPLVGNPTWSPPV
ncbi:hypothetical protein GTQ99_13800 [Kineococcus sp. T13]|uniref:hypothetical protein n=1 Tax=Kineococcus vitellinus TaxID=2696565 RepID=UPI0014120495|nr:hypothetical protein [Kineococcus vitellinus]NAZ76480.1 hypothetical protein [Kineococcus vitellinus]